MSMNLIEISGTEENPIYITHFSPEWGGVSVRICGANVRSQINQN